MLRIILTRIVTFIAALFGGSALFAAAAAPQDSTPTQNPSIAARINGVNSTDTKSKALSIALFDAKIAVRGLIAETELTLRFANSSNQTLEGEFNLDMPLGSVVSGYALDVNGQMVDGVLVPPYQAQRAYEQRVERRVDPGLVEVTHGSRFSTRVFPILPGNSRTIKLRFVTPLDPEKGYVLPLSSDAEFGVFKLSISSAGEAPALSLPSGVKAEWGKDGLRFEGVRIQPRGTLTIRPAGSGPRVTLSEHRGEGAYFEIADRAAPGGGDRASTGRIAILWDRSRSRMDHDLDAEIALATSYARQSRASAIKLIAFDGSGFSSAELSDADALAKALKAVDYGGATSFAVLDKADLGGAENCLMFSDGLATLDERKGFAPRCRLSAVTSARTGDRAFLGSRARQSGGDLIDLQAISATEAMTRLTQSAPRVVSVRDSAGKAIEVAMLEGGPNGWRIIGPAPDSGDVVITLSGLGKGLEERRYHLGDRTAPVFEGTAALWASDAIGSNAADRSRDALLALARRYSVASPLASFIVLETPQDYAQARIDPPASYPKEQRAVYASLRAEGERQLAVRKENQLKTVIAGYQERVSWWTKPMLPPVPKPRPQARGAGAPPPPPPPPPPAPPPPGSVPPPVLSAPVLAAPPQIARQSSDQQVFDVREETVGVDAGGDAEDAAAESDNIIVTSSRIQSPGQGSSPDQMSPSWTMTGRNPPTRRDKAIAVNGWRPDRPYLAALDAAKVDFAGVFRAQEKEYGTLPAFYLDVSNWLAGKGRTAEAVRMAASALDLPTRNNDTIAIVAARLTKLGELDRAIWLLEQMVILENDRPQPRRTLALALIQRAKTGSSASARADLERAYALLGEIVNTPWDGQYTGIEQIALGDANAILPRLKALGGKASGIDPALLKLLDADVRVVVEWNTKATDMDLWVDEPDEERIIYSHNRSAKGGYLSRDMTQGFGPEEYFIRKAPLGRYTVRINTFATDRLNPNGPTTVTARLYRNFGRANQSEQLIDLEIMPGSEGQRRIGAIEVGTKPN